MPDPIPAHLAVYPWYAPHCAYVRQVYGYSRHAVPDGALACRADLSRADLSDAALRGADLSRADLCGAALRGADLSRAALRGADLSRADLRGADLRGADLSRADLRGADLRRADLSDADLCGADLRDADGIMSIGPIGAEHRIIYAVRHDGGPMVQAGCFWGTVPQLREAIAVRYTDGSGIERHRAVYLAACDLIAAWGQS